MCFLTNSNDEKKIVLMTQERAIETPRPGEVESTWSVNEVVGGRRRANLGFRGGKTEMAYLYTFPY